MKHYLLILTIFALLSLTNTIFSQTASDYFMPPVPGNYLNLRTNIQLPNSTWGTRTTRYYFDETDFIFGHNYVRSVAVDIMDNAQSDSIAFQVVWLRQDSLGNISCAAMIMNGNSKNLDSATKIYPPFGWFPNEFLTAGYSRLVGNQMKDSVISVTESITVPAGSFSNCIEVCSMNLDSTGKITLRDYAWYAKGVGIVYEMRDIPANQVHTAELQSYRSVTSVNDNYSSITPNAFSLEQNYPNPFNPSTTINYSIPKAGIVKLSVYDITGSKVASLVDENKPAGSYSIHFNGSNLASGIYMYRMESGAYTASRKFILIK